MTHLIKLPEVMQRTLLSRSTIYAMLGRGEFPKPIKLGERINAWRAEDIERWLEERYAQS